MAQRKIHDSSDEMPAKAHRSSSVAQLERDQGRERERGGPATIRRAADKDHGYRA